MRAPPLIYLALLAAAASPAVAAGDRDSDAAERKALLSEIRRDVRVTGEELGMERLDPRVADALSSVPRHEFVPDAYRDQAYANRPVPIGYGQTISQPYIVAIMTALLEPEPGDRIFELGTGSGYQAAILSGLVDEVYTMEIIEPLGESARQRLKELGYANVRVRVGDGYGGWPEAAPFDGIVVTAAGDHVPPPLVRQLRPGGRMVIPVGSGFLTQQLLLVTKRADGGIETRELLPVAFVPLTGGH
ncbi:MAG: protein-L-isoaspartate(D-aspartate) O-methyltransferase [Chromatiales bacterium]|jgi:protein-L-isoaspartate(D-aspartate) O-methyltransferase